MVQDLMMLTALNVMLAKEASAAPLPVSLRDGQAPVAASGLETEASIRLSEFRAPGRTNQVGIQSGFSIAPAFRRTPAGLRPVKSRRNGPSNSQA